MESNEDRHTGTSTQQIPVTCGRLNRHLDDQLIRKARADLAKRLRCVPCKSDRRTTIQTVHEVSQTDSPLRWRLEAFLLTDRPFFHEIGEILRLAPEFIAMYHDLASEVRPRLRATDWLTCHAMSRGKRLNVEHAWKTIARAGGPKGLEVQRRHRRVAVPELFRKTLRCLAINTQQLGTVM